MLSFHSVVARGGLGERFLFDAICFLDRYLAMSSTGIGVKSSLIEFISGFFYIFLFFSCTFFGVLALATESAEDNACLISPRS
jgi:hypothetical protein